MTVPKSLVTVFSLGLAAWFVFTSLRPAETTYVITANFDGVYGNPAGAKVFITQKPGIPTDLGESREYHSCILGKDGRLKTRFSGVPNEETYVYVLKDDFVPARFSFMLRSSEEDQALGEVALLSYPDPDDRELVPTNIPCTGRLTDNPKLLQVQYLENFRYIEDFHCDDKTHTIVFNGRMIKSGRADDGQNYAILYPPSQQTGFLLDKK